MFTRLRIIFLLCFTIGILVAGNVLPASLIHKNSASVKFDCPTIIYDKMVKTPPHCGKADGSIVGLYAKSDGSKVTYQWRNNFGASLAKTADLTGVSAGVYRLEVSDNSGCASVVLSELIRLDEDGGILLNANDLDIHEATCNDGYIKGFVVTGAGLYTWTNTGNGKVYTSTSSPDLLNVPAGSYKLTASNDNEACKRESFEINIPPNFTLPKVSDVAIVQPTCIRQLTSITLTLNIAVGGPQLDWFFSSADDGTNSPVATGIIQGDKPTITARMLSQPAGAYNFFVSRDNSCPVKVGTYESQTGDIKISVEKSSVSNDKCNQHRGAIVPYFTGIVPDKSVPLEYTWTNLTTGKVISHIRSIFRIGAGDYSLLIELKPFCSAKQVFTITDDSPPVAPPIAQGSTICLPGTIGIKVTNPDTTAIFKLYTSAEDSVAVDSNVTGEFYKKVTKTTDFYLTRKHGDCESERVKVTETVVANIDIPNTFTPNGDGVNDTWKIAGMEEFPNADVRVYDRYGHNVFQSVGYGIPFDGRNKGALLRPGVYYYMIDVKKPVCYGKIAGSLTLLY